MPLNRTHKLPGGGIIQLEAKSFGSVSNQLVLVGYKLRSQTSGELWPKELQLTQRGRVESPYLHCARPQRTQSGSKFGSCFIRIGEG